MRNRKLKLTELNRLSPEEYRQAEKVPLVIVLDNIRSHHNVGSIFRTADAFKIEKIILCGFTPVPPHREIHKTALGATESVEWMYHEKTRDAVEKLKAESYEVWAVEQAENSVSLENFKSGNAKAMALVFGHEVNGVEQEVIEACKGVIEVPQYGTKHSLNISVCAGVVVWEMVNKMKSV